MRILVTAAARYGSSSEIAERLGAALRVQLSGTRATVDVRRLDEVHGLDGYDAVILGSAVYMGRWTRSARTFVAANADTLDTVPTWLFSCGSGDDIPTPASRCADGERIRDMIGARDHRVFTGRLDAPRAYRRERLLAAMSHGRRVEDGTVARVDTWAVSIAWQLSRLETSGDAAVAR
ncbi:flavodoxin [Rhodococcus sp. D2-41]|uniref:flavodoxin domain-containing protein n=1 Tax=Speluncibacter jeojiensis TaxID=2710754 RepID=UPI0024108CD4|nr:flavodoxin domain-containing protein [Rhodococcus sp. D2-41]MDG3010544.1 flavodoxin [Rhodococcus sp. D2-41]